MFSVKLLALLVSLILLGGLWAQRTREHPAAQVPLSGKRHAFEMTWWWEEESAPRDDPGGSSDCTTPRPGPPSPPLGISRSGFPNP